MSFQEHKSIENIIKSLDKAKFSVPENFNFEEARRLFREPEVTPAEELDLKWEKPDEEGLVWSSLILAQAWSEYSGVLNPDYSGFWMVKDWFGCKWFSF